MFDEQFWVAVAFVLFFVFTGRKLWPALTGALDGRSVRIRDELEQAVQLREEAQNLLSQYQRQQRESAREAEDLLKSARHEAELVVKAAGENLTEQLARREKLAEEKIALAEAKALQDVRNMVVDIAMEAAAKVIADGLDSKASSALIDHSIAELGTRLN